MQSGDRGLRAAALSWSHGYHLHDRYSFQKMLLLGIIQKQHPPIEKKRLLTLGDVAHTICGT